MCVCVNRRNSESSVSSLFLHIMGPFSEMCVFVLVLHAARICRFLDEENGRFFVIDMEN